LFAGSFNINNIKTTNDNNIIAKEINNYRESIGLFPLIYDSTYNKICSNYMVNKIKEPIYLNKHKILYQLQIHQINQNYNWVKDINFCASKKARISVGTTMLNNENFVCIIIFE